MNALIITAPTGLDIAKARELRDFVAESAASGVLVLDAGVTWEVAELPEIGYVLAAPIAASLSAPLPAEQGGSRKSTSFTGQGAREKKRIHEALLAYRRAHCLGSFAQLAAVADVEVTDAVLRSAAQGEKLPMELWRKIGAALDSLGTEG